MKTYTHPSVINLFRTLEEYIPILEKGTTKGVDPTAYSNGKIQVDLTPGLKREHLIWEISVKNFWGTEIKLSRSWSRPIKGLRNDPREMADYYIEREWIAEKKGYYNVIYQRHRGTGGLKLVFLLLSWLRKNGVNYADLYEEELRNYQPDPMGELSDYE